MNASTGRASASGAPDAPCTRCGSNNHGTGAHEKLERAYKRWGLGLTTLADQPEIDPAGTPGAPSRSTSDSVPPDRLQIVPFTISTPGREPFRGAAIMRLWKRDPEGGCTFTLSWALSEAPSLALFLEKLFGGRGFVVTVDVDSTPSSLIVGPLGTS